MLQPLIIDSTGIAHGVKVGTLKQKIGYCRMSWCGTSLTEWIRCRGYYSSTEHQRAGYDARVAVTCLACLSEGPCE